MLKFTPRARGRGAGARLALAILLPWCCPASEAFRPHYHFTPQQNWINDPNGLVFFQHEYHLFYQYNPYGNRWGHMSWGHAVSPDLVQWEELPVALPETNGIMSFSGSAVVDWQNTSGFGQNGQPPLVAIYTGHRPADNREAQFIAFSTDRGRSWTRFAGNPVLDRQSDNFRDPKVFWHEATKAWVMVVSMAQQRRVQFYRSPNLKQWTLLSEFGPAGSTNGVWECPDLFRLPVEGRSRRSAWVLVVNVNQGSPAGGSGTQYFVGQFDGATFQAEPWEAGAALWADAGRDCYAAVTWSDIPPKDGRRVWIGWMSNWDYAQDVPTTPWRNAMTLPRELSLRDTPLGLRLIQRPVRELQKLRGSRARFGGGGVVQANKWLASKGIAGDCLEMDMIWQPGRTGQCGVRLLKGEDEQMLVGFDEFSQRVFVDRRKSGNVSFNKEFPGIYQAPTRTENGQIQIHLFLDACSLELFVNDGELVFSDLVFPSKDSRRVEFFSRASEARLRSVTAWTLRPGSPGR